MSNTGPVLYPNVSVLPQRGIGSSDPKITPRGAKTSKEFDEILDRSSSGAVREPLKFSAHAMQRMQSRNIQLDPEMMGRVRDAIDRAEAKGVMDTLVLAGDSAFIVNVGNRTVVTAMDREQLAGNVFTNIDGAVIA